MWWNTMRLQKRYLPRFPMTYKNRTQEGKKFRHRLRGWNTQRGQFSQTVTCWWGRGKPGDFTNCLRGYKLVELLCGTNWQQTLQFLNVCALWPQSSTSENPPWRNPDTCAQRHVGGWSLWFSLWWKKKNQKQPEFLSLWRLDKQTMVYLYWER